jgi:hypothetical protein
MNRQSTPRPHRLRRKRTMPRMRITPGTATTHHTPRPPLRDLMRRTLIIRLIAIRRHRHAFMIIRRQSRGRREPRGGAEGGGGGACVQRLMMMAGRAVGKGRGGDAVR